MSPFYHNKLKARYEVVSNPDTNSSSARQESPASSSFYIDANDYQIDNTYSEYYYCDYVNANCRLDYNSN